VVCTAPVIAATTSSRGVLRRSKLAATRPSRSTTMRSATEYAGLMRDEYPPFRLDR
jgi:hypothetical protein